MDTRIDLGPAAAQMASLIGAVGNEQLGLRTPCEDYTVEDLIKHVDGLSQAFTAAAEKNLGPMTSAVPGGEAPPLGDGWRSRIEEQLHTLAAAWRSPEAWEGMTQAGGVHLPGPVAGMVAADELVIHGWDLARATGQPFDCDPGSLQAATRFVEEMSEPGQSRDGLFGPAVPVPDGATPLERVIAMSGRDPGWSPPA
jgi:uncharacterized protein (TIGR03086 family)